MLARLLPPQVSLHISLACTAGERNKEILDKADTLYGFARYSSAFGIVQTSQKLCTF